MSFEQSWERWRVGEVSREVKGEKVEEEAVWVYTI